MFFGIWVCHVTPLWHHVSPWWRHLFTLPEDLTTANRSVNNSSHKKLVRSVEQTTFFNRKVCIDNILDLTFLHHKSSCIILLSVHRTKWGLCGVRQDTGQEIRLSPYFSRYIFVLNSRFVYYLTPLVNDRRFESPQSRDLPRHHMMSNAFLTQLLNYSWLG